MSPGPRLDLHVHSIHSPDGRSTPAELVAAALAARLDGFALTDHNSRAGLAELAELQRRNPSLVLLPGAEVSTAEGHLLVLGDVPLPPAGRPLRATVAEVRAAGGVPVPAHPFRLFHGIGGGPARTVDAPALETLNAHTSVARNARAARIARGRRLGTTGGSDAHTAEELGTAWTRFPAGVTRPEELLRALADGRTVAEGAALGAPARLRLALRSLRLRLGRGLRPI